MVDLTHIEAIDAESMDNPTHKDFEYFERRKTSIPHRARVVQSIQAKRLAAWSPLKKLDEPTRKLRLEVVPVYSESLGLALVKRRKIKLYTDWRVRYSHRNSSFDVRLLNRSPGGGCGSNLLQSLGARPRYCLFFVHFP